MSFSIPDEGAPRNFDKRRDLSAGRSLPRLFVGPHVVRGNYCSPSPASGRKRKRGACSHTNVRDFKRESTLSASRQRHRVYRQIVSPRYNNRAKTALPFSLPPSPPPWFSFSFRPSFLLFLSLHEIFPQSSLTYAGLTHPLGFPLSTHVTYTRIRTRMSTVRPYNAPIFLNLKRPGVFLHDC